MLKLGEERFETGNFGLFVLRVVGSGNSRGGERRGFDGFDRRVALDDLVRDKGEKGGKTADFGPDEAGGSVDAFEEVNNPDVERSFFEGEEGKGDTQKEGEEGKGPFDNKDEIAGVEEPG